MVGVFGLMFSMEGAFLGHGFLPGLVLRDAHERLSLVFSDVREEANIRGPFLERDLAGAEQERRGRGVSFDARHLERLEVLFKIKFPTVESLERFIELLWVELGQICC